MPPGLHRLLLAPSHQHKYLKSIQNDYNMYTGNNNNCINTNANCHNNSDNDSSKNHDDDDDNNVEVCAFLTHVGLGHAGKADLKLAFQQYTEGIMNK